MLRFLRIKILILALLAGGAASCAAQQPKIDITPQQREQLKKLANDTREETDRERGALRHARTDLIKLYSDYNLNERGLKPALDRLHTAQLNLLKIHLDNQIGLRQVLSADQFQRFTDMISRRPGHRPGRFPGMEEDIFSGNMMNKQMLDDLGVDANQQKRAEAFMRQIKQRMKVSEKIRTDTKQLLGLYSQYNLDAHAARKLIDSIHRGQVVLSQMNHKGQQVLRSILTEAQFEQMKDKTTEKMRKHRRDDRGHRD